MTPQSNFMVAAPIAPGREPALRTLLATMNLAPGVVDPNNELVPFARFAGLHVARFVILHDDLCDHGFLENRRKPKLLHARARGFRKSRRALEGVLHVAARLVPNMGAQERQ